MDSAGNIEIAYIALQRNACRLLTSSLRRIANVSDSLYPSKPKLEYLVMKCIILCCFRDTPNMGDIIKPRLCAMADEKVIKFKG